MTGGQELHVFLDGVHAGTVERTRAGRTTFTYDSNYQSSAASPPLSFSMPIEVTEHGPKPIDAFLAGLVPEQEEARERIRRDYNLTSTQPYALLRAIGRDAAGAVQLLPAGEASTDAATSRGDVARLSAAEFSELINDLTNNPLEWDPGKYRGRWSLAGAQSKVALFRFPDGGWGVPNDSTPTTHILKPAIRGFTGHDVNEYLSMKAAAALGLDVAESEILETDGAPSVLVSTRYDRKIVDGRWARLHQEDMCQALSVHPDHKYQREDGGPGVADIADVIAQLDNKQDRERSALSFFQALVFNTAILGTDAHAKNYSLLLNRDGQTLAPLYDMASHAPYPASEPLMSAMKIGDEYKFSSIGAPQLQKASRRLHIDGDQAQEMIDYIRGNAAGAYADAAAELIGSPRLWQAATEVANAIQRNTNDRGWSNAVGDMVAKPRQLKGAPRSSGGQFRKRQRPDSEATLS